MVVCWNHGLKIRPVPCLFLQSLVLALEQRPVRVRVRVRVRDAHACVLDLWKPVGLFASVLGSVPPAVPASSYFPLTY